VSNVAGRSIRSTARGPAPRLAALALAAALAAAASLAPEARAQSVANDEPSAAETIPASGPFPHLATLIPDIGPATHVTGTPPNPSGVTVTLYKSVWYSFTPAAGATYTVSTALESGADTNVSDTVLGIYTSAGGASGPFVELPGGALTDGSDNNAGFLEASQAAIVTRLEGGTTYWIVVFTRSATPDKLIGAAPLSVQLAIDRIDSNDTAASATTLPLSTPLAGTSLGANDYTLPVTASAFPGIGQTPNAANGPDVVYSFTAPVDDEYSFRVTMQDRNSAVLYVADALPAGPGPETVTALVAASNRSSSSAEEVVGVALAAGRRVFVVVDATTFTTGTTGTAFVIEATRTRRESEPNNAPAQANDVRSGVTGSIGAAGDVDAYALGTHAADSRAFALVESIAGSSTDFRMRVTTATDTLEYDDDGGDILPGSLAPMIAGVPLPASPTFALVTHLSMTGVHEPYRLHFAVMPPTAAADAEVEPNDARAQATVSTSGLHYWSGALPGPAPSTDVDWFAFDARAGDLFLVALDGDPLRDRTPLQAAVTVYDPAGRVVGQSNDVGTTTSSTSGAGNLSATTPYTIGEAFMVRARIPGTYTVVVAGGWASSSTASYYAGDYLLAVALVNEPTISLTGGTPSPFQTSGAGIASAEQSWQVTGSDLAGTITVTASSDFEVSLTPGAGFAPSLTIAPASGIVPPTTVYARYRPSAGPGPHSGTISHTSTGAAAQDIAVSGTIVLTPTLSVAGAGALTSFLAPAPGTPSPSQSYSIAGTALTASAMITAPAPFEVATSAAGPYSSSLTLAPAGGSVSETIHVRYAPASGVGPHQGDIRHESAGALAQLVTVRGSVPVTYAFPAPIPAAGEAISNVNQAAGVTLTVFVDLGGTVLSVRVLDLTVSHTACQDLDIYLVSPSGTRIELSTDNGGTGDDLAGVTFDDAAASAISTAGTAPISGTYRPEQPLVTFAGEPAYGAWRLEVRDDAANVDIGRVRGFRLEVTATENGSPAPLVTVIDPAGEVLASGAPAVGARDLGFVPTGSAGAPASFEVRNLGRGPLSIVSVGSSAADFVVDATGMTGTVAPGGSTTFRASFAPAAVGDRTGALSIAHTAGNAPAPFSIPLAGLGLDRPPSVGTFSAQNLALTIPDNDATGVASGLLCDLGGTVLAVEVRAVSIGHTCVGDLYLRLTAPDQTTVTLTARRGGSGDNFIATAFDDRAATPIAQAAAPFTGSFRPDEPLASFRGRPAQGIWTLRVSDVASANSGTLDGWTLVVTSTRPQAPTPLIEVREGSASGAVVADGAAPQGRRRLGQVALGGTSHAATIVVRNIGTGDVNLGALALVSGTAEFAASAPGFAGTVSPGQSRSIAVTLAPSGALGLREATFAFTHDGFVTPSPFHVRFSGEAVAALGPTFTSVETPRTIPNNDPAGTEAAVMVNAGGFVSDLNVIVDADHAYVGDLVLRLHAPDGASVLLMSRRGGGRVRRLGGGRRGPPRERRPGRDARHRGPLRPGEPRRARRDPLARARRARRGDALHPRAREDRGGRGDAPRGRRRGLGRRLLRRRAHRRGDAGDARAARRPLGAPPGAAAPRLARRSVAISLLNQKLGSKYGSAEVSKYSMFPHFHASILMLRTSDSGDQQIDSAAERPLRNAGMEEARKN
jgi:subtilisin-like proprotein convertase family protein